MYWSKNYTAVSSLVNEPLAHAAPAWLLTVRGTVHLSQSDFSILYPRICALLMKMTANPQRALDLNIGASLEFLKRVAPHQAYIIDMCMHDEMLLDVEVEDEVPTLHRPEEKYIAAKLDVPHQFRARIVPKLARKIKRKERDRPRPADEIWMHVKPEEGLVERYRERMAKGGAQKDGSGELKGDIETPENIVSNGVKAEDASSARSWKTEKENGVMIET